MEQQMDMDYREQTKLQAQEPMQPASHTPPVKSHRSGSKWLKYLLVIVLIAAAAGGVYYWRDKEAKEDAKAKAAQISELEQQVKGLRSDLSAAQENVAATQSGPSEDTLKKVEEAIKAGKYSDIQNLMASKVYVIIAASEGLGVRTPAQAVNDLKYLDGGTDPWNFALAASDVKNYQDGDYAQYFPVGSLIGKSANSYVVSFTFNNDGKIIGIFMANKADIL
jgi:hypothetical protein